MPEIWTVALAARRGLEPPAYVLAHDVLVGFPVVGPALRRLGAVPTAGEEAERVLQQDAPFSSIGRAGYWQRRGSWHRRRLARSRTSRDARYIRRMVARARS